MLDATRIAHVEQVIAEADAAGTPWTNQYVYDIVGGRYGSLSQYLKARRAGTLAAVAVLEPEPPPPPVPVPEAPAPALAPLAEARAAWVHALTLVAAFDRQPRPRARAAQAAQQAQQAVLARQLQGAETRWRPLEMQARNALATALAWQAQAGRGNSVEQARCQAALQEAHAALVGLVGDAADPLATVQALLAQPVIDGRSILPPLT